MITTLHVGLQGATNRACTSLHNQYKIQTRVVDGDCYVKVGKSYRLDKDWTTPERLDYVEKMESK